ncbi:MAG: mandelate racemase/muconate lactonizing enzyme family protein [Pseudomonadota bacterium]
MTRLARVIVHHFRHALTPPVTTVMGPMTNRPAILVEVEDEEGATGFGEVWCNFPPDGDLHRARLAANVLPAALGSVDTNAPFKTFGIVRSFLDRLAIQAGEPGPIDQVASAADIAVHDLAARRSGVPLADHLRGGEAPVSVPAYASGIAPEKHEAQMERMRALGYRRFKLRFGFGPNAGIDVLEKVAAAKGQDEILLADANQAFSLEEALGHLGRLEPLGLAWLEEPIRADEPAGAWQALAEAASTPLAGGENLRGEAAFDEAVAGGALKVIQPDICKWGGLSACHAVARRAVERGLTYCPHFLGGGVGLVASAHLLAAVGGPGWLEVDSSKNPLLTQFSGGSLALEGDVFRLPPGPGLGLAVDLAGADEKRVSREERRVRR